MRLLPGWDTYLMGYRDRDVHRAPDRWKQIMLGGGMLRPAIMVGGVAAGHLAGRSGPAGESGSSSSPSSRFGARIREEIDAEIADVGRFEGARSRRLSD